DELAVREPGGDQHDEHVDDQQKIQLTVAEQFGSGERGLHGDDDLLQPLHGQQTGHDACDIPADCRSTRFTSSNDGMEGAVPARVTEMPASAQPKRNAEIASSPRASAAAKPPVKPSPAPAVSTTRPQR